MYLAIDVYYQNSLAKAVGIGFALPSEEVVKIVTEYKHEIAEYVPGQFYKRELPCLMDVIDQFELESLEAILIDGHVFVNNQSEFGLGGKLWEIIGKKAPVIGVAKNSYVDNNEITHQIYRGESRKPLFISSIGMANEKAVDIIQNMKGKNRMPDLLKYVDTLSKRP